MIKVKLLKLDENFSDFETEEEKERIGKVFEAFLITREHEENERYKQQYALNLGKYIWFVPIDCCEIVEEPTLEVGVNAQSVSNRTTKKFLLVEDGSVDIDQIQDDYGIDCIVYRQGAKKPEWLEV